MAIDADVVASIFSLQDEKCQLSHSGGKAEPAVDYLCQTMGRLSSENSVKIEHELRIPICSDCVDALESDEWVLFYCINCCSSSWHLKAISKHSFPQGEKLRWFDRCPNCKS